MEKKWLIAGGAGFIGSNFVRFILDRTSDSAVVVDKLTYAGHKENLPEVRGSNRLTFVQGDIGDRTFVDSVFDKERPSALINFAAETHVDRSIDGARPFFDTNVLGTLELLESARSFYAGLTAGEKARFRFHHVSTDEVYGSLGPTGSFSETSPYEPNSPYAASKAAADHLVRSFVHTHGLPAIITNTSNNYGPYQYPEKLIPLVILNALEGRDLPIYGDGTNVRDWLYVEDHCEGLLAVFENGRLGEKYNIGGRCERANVDVVRTICDLLQRMLPPSSNPRLGNKSLRHYKELMRFVPDRPGHDRRYAIDAAKVEREIGWKPKHSFEDGLQKTIQWYMDNADWCRAVTSGVYDRERLGKPEAPARKTH